MSTARYQRFQSTSRFRVSPKQWCCLYDAATSRLVGRAMHAGEIWTFAPDGAVLHSGEVLDTLLAAGLLRQVRRGRWSAVLPPEVECHDTS